MRAVARRTRAASRACVGSCSGSALSFSDASERARLALSTSISSRRSAPSARTMTRSRSTCRNPPSTTYCSSRPPESTVNGPGSSAEMKLACPGRMPKPPRAPGARTSSQVTCATRRSGVTISRVRAMDLPGGDLLRLLDRLLDGADHVEGLLRQVVVLALHDLLEAADRVGELHVLARVAGEGLGHVEGLREEALALAGARHDELVLLRELVHAEDGDDVLELLVGLQRLLDVARYRVVLRADDVRIEDAGGGVERIHNR